MKPFSNFHNKLIFSKQYLIYFCAGKVSSTKPVWLNLEIDRGLQTPRDEIVQASSFKIEQALNYFNSFRQKKTFARKLAEITSILGRE